MTKNNLAIKPIKDLFLQVFWGLIISKINEQEKKDLKSDMLKYCGMDIYEMIEIFNKFNQLVN